MHKAKLAATGLLAASYLGMLSPIGAFAQTAGTKTYEVTVTNITTSKQALSPVVIATHSPSAHAWQMGQMASKGLELLAEDGKPDMFAGELKGITTDVEVTHIHLMPGDHVTLRISAKDGDMLSAATMLIQTNDGFTGLDSVPLKDGDTDAMIYDAGTEDNSELMADIPGFYGALHGPDTTPHQPISMHGGITGKAEVPIDFNWSAPVARFSIHEVPATVPIDDSYDVTLTNITTSKQALSPVVLATHAPSVRAWEMGKLASKGLELLAEDGRPDLLANEWKSVATDVALIHSHLMPGDSITLRIAAHKGDVLSAATMLIQTNDGFTGLSNATLVEGNTEPMVYDAGTEDNSERKADIPGFYGALNGPDTKPHQAISMHGGITGKAEVPSDFNWSGPVARFSIHVATGSDTSMNGDAVQSGAAVMTDNNSGAVAGNSGGAMNANNNGQVPGSAGAPGMPNTGSGDTAPWGIVAASIAMLLAGLGVRRFQVVKQEIKK